MKKISRKQAIQQGLMLASATLLGSRISAAPKGQRNDWMAGKWGLMTHWIAPGPGAERGKRITDLNQAVDQFDVPGFIRQFGQTGADYLIFTVGQNTTYYAAPNAVLDKYCGPGHGSRRDLVLELAKGLKAINKRLIAYLPAEIEANPALHAGFKWNPKDQGEFEKRYTEFIRAYAVQWGTYVDGWWYDGCYTYGDYYVPRNWQLWCDVSRAGNRQAVVAFNDGSFYSGITTPMTPLQDYLSGECAGIKNGKIALTDKTDPDKTIMPAGRFVPGTRCQFHALMPIDNHGDWINEKDGPMTAPKYSDAELFPFVQDCRKAGGALTLNVGIYQEGNISQETLLQLHRLSGALK